MDLDFELILISNLNLGFLQHYYWLLIQVFGISAVYVFTSFYWVHEYSFINFVVKLYILISGRLKFFLNRQYRDDIEIRKEWRFFSLYSFNLSFFNYPLNKHHTCCTHQWFCDTQKSTIASFNQNNHNDDDTNVDDHISAWQITTTPLIQLFNNKPLMTNTFLVNLPRSHCLAARKLCSELKQK